MNAPERVLTLARNGRLAHDRAHRDRALIDEILLTSRCAPRPKGCACCAPVRCRHHGFAAGIREVFENLIDNAIKYSPRDPMPASRSATIRR